MKKKYIYILIAIVIVGLFVIDAIIDKHNEKNYKSTSVAIVVKDYGTIEVELDAKSAPETVENFLNLVEEQFYDNLTFYRIIDGFMIQGGDPNGDGSGGSQTTIKGEFSANGFNNNISHVRGVISMARSEDYNSASSQFFIVQEDSPHLDGAYAAFGHVTSGIEIVDEIVKNSKVEDDNGTVLKENQPIIETIRIIEKKDGSWE